MKQLFLGNSIINLFFQVIPICLIVTIIYILIRVSHIKKQKIEYTLSYEIVLAVFVCYLTGLINLVLVPQNFWLRIWYYIFNGYNGVEFYDLINFEFNLVPSIYKVIVGDLIIGSWVMKMLIFNVLMFVPMGFFIRLLQKNEFDKKRFYLAVLMIPLIIEILQMFIGRSFDSDDIICNFLGIILGYFIAKILYLKKN